MISTWLVVNNLFLFLCTSMYLGTGWSLVLFTFPIAPKLRTDTYFNHFVPQVTAATKFFTTLTALMLASAVVMLVAEPEPAYYAVPIVVMVGVIAAATLTAVYIFPDNKRMREGITDEDELQTLLRRWMNRSRIRLAFWTMQWLAMAVWFGAKIVDATN